MRSVYSVGSASHLALSVGFVVCFVSPRHWKELMVQTETSFEMNPDTFTLENMFAMELHKHGSVIRDIVTSAVKELSIEKVWTFPTHSCPAD